MTLTAAVHTDPGRVRSENQDSYGFDPQSGLYLVADGMGGRVAGKRASEEAVRVIVSALRESAATPADGAGRLRTAIERANDRVWQLSEADPTLHGMGTTIAAVLVDGEVAHVAHVGDSRVYRVRGGAATSLTRDHSVAAELGDQGIELRDADVRARYGNLLTRAVGVAAEIEVELSSSRIEDGDVLVICSDGVYRMVAADEIVRIIAAGGDDLEATCREIIRRANEAGGRDNSTVIVLRAAAPHAAGGTGSEPGPAGGAGPTTTPTTAAERDGRS